MYKSPDVPVQAVVAVFPEKAIDLWLRALGRPEVDLRCKAAETIARAHRRGMKGLETTIPRLIAVLDQENQDPTVRQAASQALIELEARDAAPNLLRQAQAGGNDLRQIVEPALARWDYKPAREMWLERLRESSTPQASLLLAIRCLGTVREDKASDRLRELALSDVTPWPVRLEAARALGTVRREGLEKDAARLADTPPRDLVARLVAATLLRQHQGESAVRLLQRLATDPEPAVAAVAVARLLEIDPNLVLPARDQLLDSPDARVRSLVVEALFRLPGEEHLRLLGDRLDDVHPDVRVQARRALQDLASKKEWRERVLAEGTRMLARDGWRGLEQAAILLTELDHKPAVGRLLALLTFNRAEVAVTAGWGLRRLAVRDTLPAITKYVGAIRKRAEEFASAPGENLMPISLLDYQLSQLLQLLGQLKYAPADAVLRQYIPSMAISVGGGGGRGPQILVLPEARAAAIWALGLIHEGKSEPELAKALVERLKAGRSMPPEDERVCLMSAIGLGRLRAKEALSTLETFYSAKELTRDPINNASGWAIEKITGQPLPPPKTVQAMQRDWFLAPID
jgi:HEAT repeat protein